MDATPSPASYTPRHLSEQILSLRGVIEGERKQVTVLFCDIVESTSRAASLGPEGFHELVDRFFQEAMSVVDRYAARSTSSWVTASWPCLERRWRTKTTGFAG